MDAYSQTDRRRARLALVLLVLALCERASDDGVHRREPHQNPAASGVAHGVTSSETIVADFEAR